MFTSDISFWIVKDDINVVNIVFVKEGEVDGNSIEESDNIGKVVDIKIVEEDSAIIVVGIKTAEGDSVIIVVGISGIVVDGEKGEVEIIVVWINVDINSKSDKKVKIVEDNSVVDIGKVVGINSFSILKPIFSILVSQVSEILNNFTS